MLEVIDAGSSIDSKKDISFFQLAVLANLSDDDVLKADLEDMWMQIEAEAGVPEFASSAEKYTVKARTAWDKFHKSWTSTVDIPVTDGSVSTLLAQANLYKDSLMVQLLVLERF